MSVRLSTGLPARLLGTHVGGGAEDHAVAASPPTVTVGDVRHGRRRARSARSAFASPKSSTFTMPSGVILMLAGLRSRWTMPLLVRRVERVGDLPRDRERLVDRAAARCAIRSASVSPSTSSSTSARTPPASPRGRRSRRCADDSATRASALRARSAPAARDRSLNARGRILIATSRPSLVSRAR